MKKQNKTIGVEFEKVYNYLKFNDNYYTWKSVDGKPTTMRVDNKLVEEHIKKAKRIAKQLKDDLDRELVLTETLMSIELKDLNKLDDMLKSKRKYKPKTRGGHCVDMKIGRFILPVVD